MTNETNLRDEVSQILNSVEADSREKIDTTGNYYVDRQTGMNVYENALEAVAICRVVVDQITVSPDDLMFLLEARMQFEQARLRFVEHANDNDSYGSATFHMIIDRVGMLYESLAAIAEYVDSQTGTYEER